MEIEELATEVLNKARAAGIMIATAESCTGGLVTGALTEIAGSSDAVECGFVTYSNEAKTAMLGVRADLISENGAVSAPVASAMVSGALKQSAANLAVAVTGIAGPGGGSAEKPVGLVYVAAGLRGQPASVLEYRLHDEHPEADRTAIRHMTVKAALNLLLEKMKD